MGGGQGDQFTDALQAALEGQVTEGYVVVAFFAIDVSGKSIVAPGRRKLRLGSCHPGRRVGPLASTLAPGRGVPFPGEPLLKDGAAGSRPSGVG